MPISTIFTALFYPYIAHERTAQNFILSVRSERFALCLKERHRSQNQGSVTTLYVPYVQVQHRQLGVTRLLGGKLLSVQTTVIYICAGNTGLVTLTLAGSLLRMRGAYSQPLHHSP